MHAGEEDHSLDGQHQDVDRTPRGRVSQNERTEINGESTSIVWPTLGSRTAKEQNRTHSRTILRLVHSAQNEPNRPEQVDPVT